MYEICAIWQCLDKLVFQLQHTYRENNQGVDFLSNLGRKVQHKVVFERFCDIPRQLRGVLNADRMGIPNLGCKKN